VQTGNPAPPQVGVSFGGSAAAGRAGAAVNRARSKAGAFFSSSPKAAKVRPGGLAQAQPESPPC
jgi:hypothetical protein